jgi:2-iminoacetate synthase ThiH
MPADLVSLGTQADGLRRQLHPEGVVTYCLEADLVPDAEGEPLFVTPPWQPGMTGVEYLQLVAETRLKTPVPHVLADWRKTGFKVAQIALRFGANDFGHAGHREEEIRRIIQDAGFIPKRRDAAFRALYVR